MQLEVGAFVGRYIIESLLGQGGMGEVYRARDTLLHRHVAIKILRRRAGEDAKNDTAAKILREARVIAAIQHPNIVSLFDVGEHDGLSFITMEFVEGNSLRTWIGLPDVPLEQRIRWLADVGRALDAAHRAGIVHRDIKPENILINGGSIVKVLDFGIGQHIVADESQGQDQAKRAGTPQYMAPEQVRQKDIDARTDQFAWGVVAYELCTGQMPWRPGQDAFDVFYSIVQDTPKSPRDLNPDIPEMLDRVLRRALEKEPELRFDSMMTAVAALEQSISLANPSPARLPDLRPIPPTAATFQDETADGHPHAAHAPQTVTETAIGLDLSVSNAGSTTTSMVHDEPRATNAIASNVNGAHRAWHTQYRGWGAVFLFGALGAILLGTRTLSKPTDTPSTVVSAMTTAPIVPTTMVDLPPPQGCNAEAFRLVRTGIVAQHDGNWTVAHSHFEEASKADPKCAAAFLRLTLTAYYNYPTARMREVYQRAIELRGLLSERDRGVLDALEPLVRRDPADLAECTQRLRTLVERFPGDAEIAHMSSEYDKDNNRRIASNRAALALDPQFSDAYQRLATTLVKSGDLQAAVETINACVRSAPNSVDCLLERANLARTMGQCADTEIYARKGIRIDPNNTLAYLMLAETLAAQGRSAGTIEEALQQRWARLPESDPSQQKALEQARLDALGGRFDLVEAAVRKVRERVRTDPSFEVQAAPTLLLVNVLLETNRIQDAAMVAEDFLDRRSIWSAKLHDSGADVKSMHLEPLLFDVERKAQRMTESVWKTSRTEWLAKIIPTGRLSEPTQWAIGVAMPVESPEAATTALASMPAPFMNLQQNMLRDVLAAPLFAGQTLLLAGRTDDAIRLLRFATAHCDAFPIPFEDTHAHVWLGKALEKKNDVAGACAAYAVVMHRWGKAQPPSQSARLVAKSRAALKCSM